MLMLLALCAADLTPAAAYDKVGETVSVRLTVRETGENPAGYLEAYSGAAWNAPGCFYVRVPKKAAAAVLKRLDAETVDDLIGAELRVTGKVERLDFRAAGRYVTVVVARPEQAELLARPRRDHTPTARYAVVRVAGFTLLVHPDLSADRKEYDALLRELRRQAEQMPVYLPEGTLRRLKEVRIWAERRQKGATSSAAFHPRNPGWLRGHGYNPDKAGCVEISHARRFVEWTPQQPYALLHELAHAHHYLVLGEAHEGVRAAYRQGIDRKLYESVKHVDGGTQRAYAATNEFEYFAELSEAYFGKNDFFPFRRGELKAHDPAGYALMVKVWGEPRR